MRHPSLSRARQTLLRCIRKDGAHADQIVTRAVRRSEAVLNRESGPRDGGRWVYFIVGELKPDETVVEVMTVQQDRPHNMRIDVYTCCDGPPEVTEEYLADVTGGGARRATRWRSSVDLRRVRVRRVRAVHAARVTCIQWMTSRKSGTERA